MPRADSDDEKRHVVLGGSPVEQHSKNKVVD